MELLTSNMRIVGGLGYNNDITKKKEVAKMANLYTIEDLLIGKTYRSKSIEGEILSAEKSSQPIWYGENTEAYLVEVVNPTSFKNYYRTIAVKVGE